MRNAKKFTLQVDSEASMLGKKKKEEKMMHASRIIGIYYEKLWRVLSRIYHFSLLTLIESRDIKQVE